MPCSRSAPAQDGSERLENNRTDNGDGSLALPDLDARRNSHAVRRDATRAGILHRAILKVFPIERRIVRALPHT